VASLILTTECVIKKKETPRLWGASFIYFHLCYNCP
jgi:hypothetical protein